MKSQNPTHFLSPPLCSWGRESKASLKLALKMRRLLQKYPFIDTKTRKYSSGWVYACILTCTGCRRTIEPDYFHFLSISHQLTNVGIVVKDVRLLRFMSVTSSHKSPSSHVCCTYLLSEFRYVEMASLRAHSSSRAWCRMEVGWDREVVVVGVGG